MIYSDPRRPSVAQTRVAVPWPGEHPDGDSSVTYPLLLADHLGDAGSYLEVVGGVVAVDVVHVEERREGGQMRQVVRHGRWGRHRSWQVSSQGRESDR